MTAPRVESSAEHIRNALTLLLAGERSNGDGTVTYDARDIDAIENRLQLALGNGPTKDRAQLRLLDQPRRHALSYRHHRAIRALASDTLTDDDLRAVIGDYATLTIASLQRRALIYNDPEGRWLLTLTGWDLYRELAKAND
jgi:hypothetical protein